MLSLFMLLLVLTLQTTPAPLNKYLYETSPPGLLNSKWCNIKRDILQLSHLLSLDIKPLHLPLTRISPPSIAISWNINVFASDFDLLTDVVALVNEPHQFH